MLKYLLMISSCGFLLACNEGPGPVPGRATTQTEAITRPETVAASFQWEALALPEVGGKKALLNKVSANKSHVFFAYHIPMGANAYASGLIIKDQNNQFKILSDFSAPMKNQQISAQVPGFVGKISALAAFEQGAWLATTPNGDTNRPDASKLKTLIAQVDSQGAFHSADYADRSEVLKLIPLTKGLVSLEYEGLKTPKLYLGDATKLANNIIDWKNFKAFNRTSSEMGDAALDMLVENEKTLLPIVAMSAGGLYKGLVGESEWEKAWESDSYATPPVEIFPGAPNSMAFYQGKLAVGSFTHPLNPTNQTKGFFFCDLEKTTAPNPCESSESVRAKDHEIKKMIVFKDYLFMATPKGLLRYDGNESQLFIKELSGDGVIDLAVQDDVLWVITESGAASLRIKE